MEQSIVTLRQKTLKNELMNKVSIKKKTAENTELIDELNTLRKSRKALESKLEALQL